MSNKILLGQTKKVTKIQPLDLKLAMYLKSICNFIKKNILFYKIPISRM